MKRGLILFLTYIFISVGLANAQAIKGTIISGEDNEPIVGASVLVKGTSTGTITDIEGNFSFSNVPSSATTFVVSYIGMKTQEIAIKPNLRIILQADARTLDEVVVTAVGMTRSEKSLGYAVSKVKAEDVVIAGEPDMLKSLQGKVAGVDVRVSQGAPGAASKISIRGNSSFSGSSEPLIIVDGVPLSNQQVTTSNQLHGSGGAYAGGLSSIDPNDIASMNVLKGSAAAAIYGSRASNGVIIIKTKSGSTTTGARKLGITLNSSYSVENIANLPDYQNSYGAGFNDTYSNSNGSWGPSFASVDKVPVWPDYLNAYPELFPEDGMIEYKAVPNNVKDLFRTGGVLDNSVSLSGGTETSTVNATLSRMQHDGYIPNSAYKRVAMSVGGATELGKKLKLNANISYTNTDQKGSMYGENQYDGASSSFARTLYLARNWDLTSYPYQNPDGSPLSTLSAQYDNPLWCWEHNLVLTETDRTMGSFGISWAITPWLNAVYNLGINVYNLNRQEITDIGSRAASGLGQLKDDKYRSTETESTFLLTFQKEFFEDYSFKAVLGHNVNERKSTRTFVTGTEFKTSGIYNLQNCKSYVVYDGYYSKHRLMGVFLDLTLGYKNWAFLGFTGRNDWSSTLPKNNRSYFYPAITGSMVFTDAFDIANDVFNFGKVRVGWAKVGRDASPYYLTDTYNLENTFRGETVTSIGTSAGNPNLEPEFTQELELGGQLDFFSRRLSFDFTWYNKITTNLIAPITLSNASGFSSMYSNYGKIRNRGVEIEVKGTPIETKDFRWEIAGNFTSNRNVVLELKDGVERLQLSDYNYAEVNMPFGYLRGTKSLRDENGNLLIDPADGTIIEAADEGMIGDPNPDFKIGLNTTLTYKGFFLNAHFDWTEGGSIYSSSISSYLGRGVTKDTEDREHTWVIPGYYGNPNTMTPILDANGNQIPNATRLITANLYFGKTFATNASDEWNVYDATVYRLREISFGYNFPKSILKSTPFNNLMVSVSGNNLWYFAPNVPRYTNYDPEIGSFGTSITSGVDVAAAPSAKRWTVNLRVSF